MTWRSELSEIEKPRELTATHSFETQRPRSNLSASSATRPFQNRIALQMGLAFVFGVEEFINLLAIAATGVKLIIRPALNA